MDSLICELQIVFYFQLFLSTNVRHSYLQQFPYLTSIFYDNHVVIALLANFCSGPHFVCTTAWPAGIKLKNNDNSRRRLF